MEAGAQETEVSATSSSRSVDHKSPSKTSALPEPSTATQNVADVHEIDVMPTVSTLPGVDQLPATSSVTSPAVSATAQKPVIGHEIDEG